MSAAESVPAPDAHERNRDRADRLWGDRVVLPITSEGHLDLEALRRDGCLAASDPDADQNPARLGVLIDGFRRFDPDAPEGISVVVLDRKGDPQYAQFHGPDFPEAVTLVQETDRAGTRLVDIRSRPVVRLLRLPTMPAFANDNVPFAAIDGQTLLGLAFAPVEYVVPGYVTEGLTILAGRPKLGKSWMVLGFCVGVAAGRSALGVECEQGDVLYLALEDNRRRLQDRLRIVLPKDGSSDISRLQLMTEAPKIGAGLIERLDRWRLSVAEPKLVVIDTLSMVRPPKKANQDSYASDYDAISPLQKWAGLHRIAVIVVHHVRKAEAEDPLESVSGTNGLTGAADTILVLNRTGEGPKLYGRGRDIEEVEKALRLTDGVWTVLGNADDVKRSDQRNKIMAVLEDAGALMSPAEIATAAGVSVTNVQYLLKPMIKAGEVEKVGYAQYKIPGR